MIAKKADPPRSSLKGVAYNALGLPEYFTSYADLAGTTQLDFQGQSHSSSWSAEPLS